MEHFQNDEVAWSRLQWRCRRGLLELDLVLQAFLREGYAMLTGDEKQHLDRLLELPDDTLLAYIQGREKPSDNDLKEIIKKIS
ncbi:MAG: FAD assembly factor SdhE [Acidiferrobacterales bacterium]